jgi:hypothetical protein
MRRDFYLHTRHHGIYSPHQEPGTRKDREADSSRQPRPSWVVGAAHSWMNRFRKALVRFEKLESSFLGLRMFSCAFIAFRKAFGI